MAVGDAVVLGLTSDEDSVLVPLIGIVNAEIATDASVLWRNAELSLVPMAALKKVFPGRTELVGKWLQIAVLPFLDPPNAEGFPPKSPASSGPVLDVFGTGLYDAGALSDEWVVVSTEDGRRAMRVLLASSGAESNLVFEQPGRRNV